MARTRVRFVVVFWCFLRAAAAASAGRQAGRKAGRQEGELAHSAGRERDQVRQRELKILDSTLREMAVRCGQAATEAARNALREEPNQPPVWCVCVSPSVCLAVGDGGGRLTAGKLGRQQRLAGLLERAKASLPGLFCWLVGPLSLSVALCVSACVSLSHSR